MEVGVLKIRMGECISDGVQTDINRVSYLLGKHGYFVRFAVDLCDAEKIPQTFDMLAEQSDAVLVCGDTDAFYRAMSDRYNLNRELSAFLLHDTPCAVAEVCDDTFVHNTLIPLLNGQSKTFYATVTFRTIGKSEEQLRNLLKDCIKNRNKIVFKFLSEPPECRVLIRYSNKTQKNTVSELLAKVTEILKDCTYSYDDEPLSKLVADRLMAQNKTLGLAESFTGGNIAASLVQYAGISSVFKEGIVCYSNDVKCARLHVSPSTLNAYGAVSDETAYQMAVNLLMDGAYDYVIATTGNAGPAAEKEGEVGVCYIAVGDRNSIDIYPYRFDGDRQAVIHKGTQTALFHLLKRIVSDAVESNEDRSGG